METLNALAVRKRFGSVLDRVWKEKTPITITRANKPLIVMVPFDDYERMMMGSARRKKLRLALNRLRKWSERNESYLIDFDVVVAVREARRER